MAKKGVYAYSDLTRKARICLAASIIVSSACVAAEIPDDWEDSHAGFNKHNASSFSPEFVYGDDEEVWCEMNAINERGHYDKDWSNPGKQSHEIY